ncbi:hypothetical protein ACTSKR_07340 [Chitinibacteraceae bacterium HSL-7]
MSTQAPRFNRPVIYALIASMIALHAGGAFATTNRNFSDLMNRRSDDAAEQMRNRGYEDVHVERGQDRNWHNWWNAGAQDCVVASEQNGRYIDFQQSLPADCTPYAKNKSGIGTGVAVAAGAAALIGAVALINHNKKKHDKEDEQQRNDEQYRRGYDDGLAARYGHNDDHTDEYRNGFSDGLRERNEHRSQYGSHNDRNRHDHRGNTRHVDVSDLNGMRASSGEYQLQQRGFHNVDGQKGWHRAYTSWWNPSARECVHVVTRDGRYQSVTVVSQNSCV